MSLDSFVVWEKVFLEAVKTLEHWLTLLLLSQVHYVGMNFAIANLRLAERRGLNRANGLVHSVGLSV